MMNRFFSSFVFVLVFSCQKDSFQIKLSETILGNWNIERGGNFIFEKNSFSASLGCNKLFGEIRIINEKINFYSIASTKIGCTEELSQLEEQFVSLLENSTLSFNIEGKVAKLYNSKRELIFKLYR